MFYLRRQPFAQDTQITDFCLKIYFEHNAGCCENQ